MGTMDCFSPKAISNRMKSKGLGKLKLYCPVCKKQCRDENGFKCHCMSESHQRNIQLAGENLEDYIQNRSKEFEESFLDFLKLSHRCSRVSANRVYNEFIRDKHHDHMKSTKWLTLTEFVNYLGETCKCKVEDTPKGLYITYIDRDSKTTLQDGLKNKRLKTEVAEEERQEHAIQKQIESAAAQVVPNSLMSKSLLDSKPSSEPSGGKIAFRLGSTVKPVSKDNGKKSYSKAKMIFEESKYSGSCCKDGNVVRSVVDEVMKEEEKDYWLCRGIIVKVTSKAPAVEGYYKKKGVVVKVIDKYVGDIEMLDSKHVLRVDQKELETVIPQTGGLVRIVNGAYRGLNARLISVDKDEFSAEVQIEKGVYNGRRLRAVHYDHICQLAH